MIMFMLLILNYDFLWDWGMEFEFCFKNFINIVVEICSVWVVVFRFIVIVVKFGKWRGLEFVKWLKLVVFVLIVFCDIEVCGDFDLFLLICLSNIGLVLILFN